MAEAIDAVEQLKKSIPKGRWTSGSLGRETVESMIDDVHTKGGLGQSNKERRIECTACQKVIKREVLARGTGTLFSEVDEST